MIDIACVDGDIVLKNGEPIIINSVAQTVYITFAVWLGDWFYNLTFGIDYTNLKKNYPIELVNSMIQAKLLSIPGVISIVKFAYEFNSQTRTYNFSVSYLTTDSPQNVLQNRLTLNV